LDLSFQGLAYIHENETISGGELYFYPDGPGGNKKWFEAKSNKGMFFDGDKVPLIRLFFSSSKMPYRHLQVSFSFTNYENSFHFHRYIIVVHI